jgi:hypothetical protein
MAADNDRTKHTSIEHVWQRALQFAVTDSEVLSDLEKARRLNPSQVTDSDFLRQCAWSILGARRRNEILKSRWLAIEKAFFIGMSAKLWHKVLQCRQRYFEFSTVRGR